MSKVKGCTYPSIQHPHLGSTPNAIENSRQATRQTRLIWNDRRRRFHLNIQTQSFSRQISRKYGSLLLLAKQFTVKGVQGSVIGRPETQSSAIRHL